MGYRVDTRVQLDLPAMPGAEVEVLIGVPLSDLREWDAATTLDEEWSVFLRVAKPTWNLEDEAGPIPAEEASLDRLPRPVSVGVMRGWREAAVNPPAPLPPPSSDGEQ